MSPKEKAAELVNKFKPLCAIDITDAPSRLPFAKQCALIAVDSIKKEVLPIGARRGAERTIEIFWGNVEEEINKLQTT